MSEETKIQWCDSTVNPIMGCGGYELFPKGTEVLATVDQALVSAGVARPKSKPLIQGLINGAYAEISNPSRHHHKAVND